MGVFLVVMFLWVIVMIVFQFKTKSGKVYGSWAGQRTCVYCGKRLKYNMAISSYSPVCPRCGRDQPRSDSPSSQSATSHYAPSTHQLIQQIESSKVVAPPTASAPTSSTPRSIGEVKNGVSELTNTPAEGPCPNCGVIDQLWKATGPGSGLRVCFNCRAAAYSAHLARKSADETNSKVPKTVSCPADTESDLPKPQPNSGYTRRCTKCYQPIEVSQTGKATHAGTGITNCAEHAQQVSPGGSGTDVPEFPIAKKTRRKPGLPKPSSPDAS